MFCVKCGARIPSESAFCLGCGQRVQADSDEISNREAAECADGVRHTAEEQRTNTEEADTIGSSIVKFKNLVHYLWAVVILDAISTVSDLAEASVCENVFGCIETLLFIWLTLAVSWRKSWARKLYVCYTSFILLLFSFAGVGIIYASDGGVDAVDAVLNNIEGLTIVSCTIQLYCACQLLFNQKIKLLFESGRKETGAQADTNRLSCILWLLVFAVTWVGCSFNFWSQIQNAVAEGVAEGIAEAEISETPGNDDEAVDEEYLNNLENQLPDVDNSDDEEGRTNSARKQNESNKAKAIGKATKTVGQALFKAGIDNSGKIAKLLKYFVLGLIAFVFSRLRGK